MLNVSHFNTVIACGPIRAKMDGHENEFWIVP